MFRLHQSTRRRCCQAGFVLLGLLPLVALVIWGELRRTSAHVRSHQAVLHQKLGLRATIARVSHPRPGVVEYHDLALADAETGRPIARCDLAELREPGFVGQPTAVAITGLSLPAGAATPLYALVDRLLRGVHGEHDLYVTLAAHDIGFAQAERPQDVAGIRATIRSADIGGEVAIEFLAANVPGPASPAAAPHDRMLRIVRNRQQGKPTDGVELHTGADAFPIAWLMPLSGDLAALEGSRFRGSLWANEEADGWHVAVGGTLIGVDLGAIVSRNFRHRLQGRVDLEIHSARAVAGRLTAAECSVTGGPGIISRSLLAAGSHGLGFLPAYQLAPADELFQYERLAASITLHPQGQLVVAGKCLEAPGAVLVATDGQPLWTQAREARSALALVAALSGPENPAVPATAQGAWLMQRLPLRNTPDARREAPAEASTNRAVKASHDARTSPLRPGPR